MASTSFFNNTSIWEVVIKRYPTSWFSFPSLIRTCYSQKTISSSVVIRAPGCFFFFLNKVHFGLFLKRWLWIRLCCVVEVFVVPHLIIIFSTSTSLNLCKINENYLPFGKCFSSNNQKRFCLRFFFFFFVLKKFGMRKRREFMMGGIYLPGSAKISSTEMSTTLLKFQLFLYFSYRHTKKKNQ